MVSADGQDVAVAFVFVFVCRHRIFLNVPSCTFGDSITILVSVSLYCVFVLIELYPYYFVETASKQDISFDSNEIPRSLLTTCSKED